MNIYSQRDIKWGKDKMGNSGLELEDYGCLCTSISMLDGRTPKEINTIFSENGAYNSNGILNHEIASRLLGLNYGGFSSTPQYFPIIAEVDMSPSPGKQQHFVIQESEESILDPWTGTRRSHKTYPIISYRLYKKVTQETMKIETKLKTELKKYNLDLGDNLDPQDLEPLRKEMETMRKRMEALEEELEEERKMKKEIIELSLKTKEESEKLIGLSNDLIAKNEGLVKEIKDNEGLKLSLENSFEGMQMVIRSLKAENENLKLEKNSTLEMASFQELAKAFLNKILK